MAILQNSEPTAKEFGDEITGVHSAIKQFVEATKGEGTDAPIVDKGKKSILKKAVKNAQ